MCTCISYQYRSMRKRKQTGACSVKASQSIQKPAPDINFGHFEPRFEPARHPSTKAKMEDRLMRKSEEEMFKQQEEEEKERLEEEERRWTEETMRKLAEVERGSEKKGRRARGEEKGKKGPRADEEIVVEVLVSRDGYKLIK